MSEPHDIPEPKDQQEPQGSPPASPPAKGWFSPEFVSDLRAENAMYRTKYQKAKEELKGVAALKDTAKAYGELQTRHTALESSLRSSNLTGALRADLAGLGITDKGKQDLVIRAAMPDISAEFGEDHSPTGEFKGALETVVQTLGLMKPEGEDAPKPNGTAAPITITAGTPDGPQTYEQILATGQEILKRAKSGG